MRNCLAIETSTQRASVALVDQGQVRAQTAAITRDGHGAGLAPLVALVLDEAGVTPQALGGIAVALGPGAFTGLRVGLALAKGMAQALGTALAGVSTLAAMARHGHGFDGLVVPILDARRGEVYAAAFDGQSGAPVIEACVAEAGTLAQQLATHQRPCLCFGEGWLRYRDCFAALATPHEPAPHMHHPDASHVAALAVDSLATGGNDLATLVPHYIRRSYADA